MCRPPRVMIWALVFALFCFVTGSSPAADVTSTWDGTDGVWSDSTKWDSALFPNNGNAGLTYDAVIAAGAVDVDQPIGIDALLFTGGTISGADALTLSSLTWTGGSFTGTGLVTVGGGLWGSNVFNTLLLEGTTMRLAGNVDWAGDHISYNSTVGTLEVAAGTTLTRADGTIYGFGAGQTYDLYANVLVEAGATFRHDDTGVTVLRETFTNDGALQVDRGTVQIGAGFTNFDALTGTLTGGQYEVTSTFQFDSANIVTNRAKLVLVGPGSSITDLASVDALGNLAMNDTGATLELHNGRSLWTTAALTNRGTISLFGGSLNSSSTITTTAGSTLSGFGSVLKRPNNAGRIQAAGGTLNLPLGVQGTGILEASAGGTLDVSAGASGSTTGSLILQAGGGLTLGARTVIVSSDFDNRNAGSANAYNPRAGVSGTGSINSSVAKTQSLSGAVTGGTTAMPSIALGSVRIGVSGQNAASAAFRVNNSAGGPSLRGAVKSSGNGANLVGDSQFAIVGGPRDFGPVAPSGQSEEFSVSFTGVTPGSVTRTLAVVNNFDNVANQTVSVTAAAYSPATPNITPAALALGDFHVGQPAQQAIAISNATPVGAFSESLVATASATGGGVSVTGGPTVTVAPGATNSTIGVAVSTATAGAKSGSVNIARKSTGAVGLADLDLGSQAIPVSATVYRLAQPVIQSAQPINFGIVHVGDVVSPVGVAVQNSAAADGFSERLDATLGPAPTGFTASGSGVDNLNAGAMNSTGLLVGINTSIPRTINGSINVNFTSDGVGINSLGQTALASQSVTLAGTVNAYADPNLVKTGGVGTLTEATPNSFVLDLGGVRRGGAALQMTFSVANAVAAPADTLAGTWTIGSGPFSLSGFGAVNGLAPGASSSALSVLLGTAAAGQFAHAVSFAPRSQNGSGYDGAMAPLSLLIKGAIFQDADFNEDLAVNGADLALWRNGFGTPSGATHSQGDADLNGAVSGADLLIWQRQYSPSLAAVTTAAVPEPGAIVLALLCVATLAAFRPIRRADPCFVQGETLRAEVLPSEAVFPPQNR